MLAAESAQVGSYFDGASARWDRIYSQETNALMNILNRRFRKGVYNRAVKVIEIIGKEKECVKSVLDVGCGSGRIALQLAAMKMNVTGIDMAAGMIALARNFSRNNHLEEYCSFIEKDFMELPFGPCSFDVSIAMGVLDYISHFREFLEKMRECTSRLILVTFPIKGTLRSHVRKIRLSLKRCPVFYYDKEELRKLYQSMNFSGIRIERVNNQYFVTARI